MATLRNRLYNTNGNQNQEPRQHMVAVLVENKPGVLNRVVSMFRRRNFNLDSLTVGRTHKPHISRMTIMMDASRANAHQLVANLQKLINVIDVRLLSAEPHVSRDLALIKVRTEDSDSFNHVTEICERTPARIVDMGTKVCIVEICAPEDVVEDVELHDGVSSDGGSLERRSVAQSPRLGNFISCVASGPGASASS